ncbi:serine/threonine-protein kinase [Bacillus toyonensis]|uniref:serine/threonine-protein kinase n=1 Tax=Bacillus toyonensis TaxID=155322 RepID=UPI001EE1294F|nr:serine/threonine-protein kinase [Bacillus toyonensis]MCG3797036.1 serine/threonine-protein kinase [Bacillus toyonensis]
MQVNVESIFDLHKYIRNQNCNCGGNYEFRSSSVNFNETKENLEDTVTIQCLSCHKKQKIQFSLPALNNELRQIPEIERMKNNWPIPRSGPYVVKEREYKIRMREVSRQLSSGKISYEELLGKWQTIYNEAYPRIAGRYQIIGNREGGMGSAYLCFDTKQPGYGMVVCKTLKIKPDNIEIESIRKEAETWIKLGNHPNVVNHYDAFVEGSSRIILITEAINPFAKSICLEDLIESNEKLDIDFLVGIFFDLVRGILHCQQKIDGFVHGDLKPSNLLISEDGHLKITDFGLVITRSFKQNSVNDVYTDCYLAPECFNGIELSELSDVYAFGLIMYKSITGKHPYSNYIDREDLIYRHKNIEPSPIKGIDEWLSKLIMECLKKDKSLRPTFKELYDKFRGKVSIEDQEPLIELPNELNNVGVSLQSIGKYHTAMDYLLRASLDNIEVLYNMATTLSKAGDKKNSEAIYGKLINLPELPADVYANYAGHILRYYKDEEKLKEGLESCEKALVIDKYNLIAHINKCAVLNSLKDFSKAIQSAFVAKQFYPKNCNVLFEYATANYGLGKWGKALTFVNRVLKLDPNFIPAQILKNMIGNKSK